MNLEEQKFWHDLDIAVEDVFDLEKTGKRPVVRLSNRMKKSSGWLDTMKIEYNKKRDTDLKEFLQKIFGKNKTDFYRLFFLYVFSTAVDKKSIMNRVPSNIFQKYDKLIKNKSIDVECLLLPIYKHDQKILVKIYYDTLINKSTFKPYRTEKLIDAENVLVNLTIDKIEKFFEKLKKDKVIRRNVKVWWFETSSTHTSIIVRLESNSRQAIHQVSKNTFLKTAGHRALLFSEKGNKLEVLSKEPDSVAKWASTLLTINLQKNVTFAEVVQEFESDKVVSFVNKTRNENIDNVLLLGIEKKNAPLPNSPTLTLESEGFDSLKESLTELEKKGIPLITATEDIAKITLGIGQRIYRLSLSTINGITTVKFDTKNLSEEEKNTVRQLLKKEISV